AISAPSRLAAGVLILVTTLILPGAARAGEAVDPNEPPQRDRPANFNGAVGSYEIETRAEPTTLSVEDPLTSTGHVPGSGPARPPPRRPRLAEFPKFKEEFYIEDLPDPRGGKPGGDGWTFAYRLKPKHLGVKKVPGLPLVYYDPALKKYQTSY